MPAMPRPKGQGKKIAFAILGTPANMMSKESKKKKEIGKVLDYDETKRVR